MHILAIIDKYTHQIRTQRNTQAAAQKLLDWIERGGAVRCRGLDSSHIFVVGVGVIENVARSIVSLEYMGLLDYTSTGS